MGRCTHGCWCPGAPARDQPPPALQESEDDDEEEDEEEDEDDDEDDDDDNGDSSEEGGDSSESSSEEESEDGDEVRLRWVGAAGRAAGPSRGPAPLPYRSLCPPALTLRRGWGGCPHPGSDRTVAEEVLGSGGGDTGRRRGPGSTPHPPPKPLPGVPGEGARSSRGA